jgi:hypothetical protein
MPAVFAALMAVLAQGHDREVLTLVDVMGIARARTAADAAGQTLHLVHVPLLDLGEGLGILGPHAATLGGRIRAINGGKA